MDLPTRERHFAHRDHMQRDDDTPARVRWARLRLQIIGTLLASPRRSGRSPPSHRGAGGACLEASTHGRGGALLLRHDRALVLPRAPRRRSARRAGAQGPQARWHSSEHPARARAAIAQQHRDHPRWSVQAPPRQPRRARSLSNPHRPVPGYCAVRRYMKQQGLVRARKRRHRA